MQPLLVSACLLIFSSTCLSAPKPRYAVIVPAWTMERSQQKACVAFFGLEGDVNVTLELQKDEQVKVIVDHKIDTPDFFHCFNFQVPALEREEEWSVWLFHVSAFGEHINGIKEVKKILILKLFDVCFIQTDKAEYKPGDTVKFRVMTMDLNFRASEKKIAVLELMDSNGYRIGQWLNITSNHGIADFSFSLANELSFGKYKIYIPNDCDTKFTVSEYVPKRFEVKTKFPSNVTIRDESFHLESCGSYVYGKPVEGTVDITLCPSSIADYWTWIKDFVYRLDDEDDDDDNYDDDNEQHSEKCLKISNVKTDSKGCLSREIDLSFFNFSRSDRETYLKIKTSLTELSTGHSEKASTKIYLGNYRKIKFIGDFTRYYYRGVPHTGKLLVTDEYKRPLANEVISLFINEEIMANVVTNNNGIANFMFNTSTWEQDMLFVAMFSSENEDSDYYSYTRTLAWLVPLYSESGSFLILEKPSDRISCDSDVTVTVKYEISKNSIDPNSDHLTFLYFVLSKGGIVSYKEHKLDIKDASRTQTLRGSFAINVHVDAEIAPEFSVFVFSVLHSGETISNVVSLIISECSMNKVQLSFSEAQVHPGDKVTLKVTADPGSWCSVRSVDVGYLPHKPRDDTSYISAFLGKNRERLNLGNERQLRFTEDPLIHHCQGNEIPERQMPLYAIADTFRMLQTHNLKMFTNTRIQKPVKCAVPEIKVLTSNTKKYKKVTFTKIGRKKHLTRAYFPDTWLYDLVYVGPEGHTEVNLTTPDRITKWETDAICLGKSGLGKIKGVVLTTFQPYFIDLILPYSVVQGETFKIKALLFSYEKKCMLVVATLSDSEDFTTGHSKEQARCVCEGHSIYFIWDATVLNLKNLKIHVSIGSLHVEGGCTADPFLLGKDHREDTIEKNIIVKARGHEEQKTETFLIYPGDNRDKIQVSYQEPERLVPGSARARIIVLGDLIGNPIANLESMLNMPDSSGDHNIVKISRIIDTLQYLQITNESKPLYQKQALEYLTKAYQKQLTFKREDGSYGIISWFNANLWLTADVVKTFTSAQDFIYIDETHVRQAVTWLQSQQLSNGCFEGKGYYFSNDFQTENEIAQTAFVLISLLENPVAYNGSIVENALKCLRNGAHNVTSPFTQSLMAYAFTLSGDHELRQETLERLEETAIKKDGSKHWKQSRNRYRNIETSSYVILALLSEKTTTQRDLEESADIIRWIVGQQSMFRGVFYFQDTTVSLQAMAKYAKAMHHKKGDATVTIESKSGFHKEIHVDKSNSLLVQTVDLPEFPGEYTVTVTGNGYVYVQSHLQYNSLPDHSDAHFALNVSTEPAVCTNEGQTHFEVHVDVRYSGKRAVTNMAVIMVEFLSGFHADEKSVKKLEKNPTVNSTEVSVDKIAIYLDKLTHEAERFTFGMRQEIHVENLQPANVIVFDYYVPDEQAITEYNSPCSAVKGHCRVGVSERRDCGHSGITREHCEQRGCCFDSSVSQAIWCFYQGFEKEESQ